MNIFDYYDHAIKRAGELQKDLGVENHQCKTLLVPVDGKRKQGWRVTVTRWEDGVSQSRFVGEKN